MKVITHAIGKNGAVLTCYLQKASEAISGSDRRPAVLIFPGGGYEIVSDAENEPVAAAYTAKGFQAFTLAYSVKSAGVFPAPQREAFESIAYIRRNAERFHVDPDRIALIGFSAGGHLAASAGVYWDTPRVNDRADREECRPNALVLIYPCITAGEYAYPGLKEVHGKNTRFPDLIGLEDHVDKKTPPAYLCHTAADMCVPAMNSLLFASALARVGVPFALRIFKDGPHGMSLATKAVSSPILQTLEPASRRALRDICAKFSEWFDDSAEFLRSVFAIGDE